MTYAADVALVRFVDRLIRSGKTEIVVPFALIDAVSPSTVEEVRQLAKLSGVKIVLEA